MTILLLPFVSCQSRSNSTPLHLDLQETTITHSKSETVPPTLGGIPVPEGYKRMEVPEGSFADWLRALPLKKDKRVFLYNGELKRNQSAQFAVLSIPVGKKDLQQCADAIMRLRAQYLHDQKRYNEICFADNNGKKYNYSPSSNMSFENYLDKVFSYCGTLSLEKQLEKVRNFLTMQPGDVLIKGGSPGHAVIIADMAVDSHGRCIYLLAQSYMPAQDIHVLKNPMSSGLSPWYQLADNALIHTPEWTFEPGQLRKW
jgi:hypothetical protein